MEAVKRMTPNWGHRWMLALADGAVCGLCYVLLSDFLWSSYAQLWLSQGKPLSAFCVLWGTMALLCAFLLQRILRRLQRKRDMVFHVFVSLAVRVLVIGLYLVNLLTLHIRLFPVGEFWYGNAFEYLLMIVAYLICSGVLRLGALAAHLIRCSEKR